MAVSLRDISKATGLSVSTVSRVLSKSDYPVSEGARQRVLEAAQRMGYRPNLAARGLRTERTGVVGVLVDDIMSPFVPPIVRGIQDCLAEHDLSSLVVNSDWSHEREEAAIRSLLSRPVDGMIFVEYSHRAQHAALDQSQKPIVFVHRLFGTPTKNSIVPDDEHGAMLAVRHLLSLGHQRIGFVAGPVNWHSADGRLAGYRKALRAQGLPVHPTLVQPGDWEPESGYRAATALLQTTARPTALFSANDLMALGAIYAVKDAGLKVPDDMAIVGYDNRDFSRIVRPNISTVNMPVYEMGHKAAALLVTQIAGRGDVDELKVKGRLIVRETCGADPLLHAEEDGLELTRPRRLLLDKEPDA